jgi:hypothetical protein
MTSTPIRTPGIRHRHHARLGIVPVAAHQRLPCRDRRLTVDTCTTVGFDYYTQLRKGVAVANNAFATLVVMERPASTT